jgi:hypothetical protein
MAFYYDQLDENGNIVLSKVRLLPTTSLPDGHRWVEHTPDLQYRRTLVKQKIKEIRDHKLSSGGFKVGDKWFHSDPHSRTQQIALTMLGSNLPNNIDWKTMDKSMIRLTPEIVGQLFSSAVNQDNSIFTKAEALMAQIDISGDPESININIGWPETYGV